MRTDKRIRTEKRKRGLWRNPRFAECRQTAGLIARSTIRKVPVVPGAGGVEADVLGHIRAAGRGRHRRGLVGCGVRRLASPVTSSMRRSTGDGLVISRRQPVRAAT